MGDMISVCQEILQIILPSLVVIGISLTTLPSLVALSFVVVEICFSGWRGIFYMLSLKSTITIYLRASLESTRKVILISPILVTRPWNSNRRKLYKEHLTVRPKTATKRKNRRKKLKNDSCKATSKRKKQELQVANLNKPISDDIPATSKLDRPT